MNRVVNAFSVLAAGIKSVDEADGGENGLILTRKIIEDRIEVFHRERTLTRGTAHSIVAKDSERQEVSPVWLRPKKRERDVRWRLTVMNRERVLQSVWMVTKRTMLVLCSCCWEVKTGRHPNGGGDDDDVRSRRRNYQWSMVMLRWDRVMDDNADWSRMDDVVLSYSCPTSRTTCVFLSVHFRWSYLEQRLQFFGFPFGKYLNVWGDLFSCSWFARAHFDVAWDEFVPSEHLALVGENDLSSAARRINGQSFVKALFDVGTPDTFSIVVLLVV